MITVEYFKHLKAVQMPYFPFFKNRVVADHLDLSVPFLFGV